MIRYTATGSFGARKRRTRLKPPLRRVVKIKDRPATSPSSHTSHGAPGYSITSWGLDTLYLECMHKVEVEHDTIRAGTSVRCEECGKYLDRD